MKTETPLRYPGGKSVMTSFIEQFIEANAMKHVVYVEPYAGGAGAALKLLFKGIVERIHINDANDAVYAFWYSLLHESKAFLSLFDTTQVNLEEWFKQKQILVENNLENPLSLGFAFFFLNRCNRSGILTAGPIGGNTEEKQIKANYTIEARFRKPGLRQKLEKIIQYKGQIKVTHLDALRLLRNLNQRRHKERLLVYLDPPYYKKGAVLYMNAYKLDDHKRLAQYLQRTFRPTWLLSYDNVSEIRKLYQERELYHFSLNYSVEKMKKGDELLLHSKNSIFPENPQIIQSSKKNIAILPQEPTF